METFRKMEEATKDLDAARKIYAQIVQEDNQTPLSLRPFPKRLTLRSLLRIVAGSDSDSSSESSSSSGSDCDSPLTGSSGLWSRVLNEDGHLCLDRIVPQLPPPIPFSEPHKNMYIQSVRCAAKALAHYNAKNKDSEYEFVAPLLSNGYASDDPYAIVYIHANFLARLKGSRSVKLFFVEMKGCGVDEDDDPVIRCSVIDPQTHQFLGDIATSAPREVFHPVEDSFCSECHRPIRAGCGSY